MARYLVRWNPFHEFRTLRREMDRLFDTTVDHRYARDDRHIRIDALSRVMPKGWIRISRVIVDLFAAIVCAIIAWQVYRYVQLEIEFEDTVLVDVPAWVVHGIMPVAFVLTGYRFVVNAIRRAMGIERDDEEGVVL